MAARPRSTALSAPPPQTNAVPSTEVLVVDPAVPDPGVISRAAACLRRGGLVGFPTETVYGLGADALNPAAVQRIFDAKGRPASDPLIVHLASLEQLPVLVTQVPPAARALGRRFWPGPLTLVLPRTSRVPDVVTAGRDTVAVRIPAHPVAAALLRAAQIPVAAPSANLFSRPSPTRASHVLDDLDGRIDMLLDGGSTSLGVESTVLDLCGPFPVVLRPGAIALEALREVIGTVEIRELTQALNDPSPMASPGQLSRHYSPRAPLTLYEGDADRALSRLNADARTAEAAGKRLGVLDFGLERDPNVVAARLYAALRDVDTDDVDLILVRGPASMEGLGRAIQDRLRRAAAGRIVRA